MTTLFENLNEQLFTDISYEQAEMIQGGYNFEAWNLPEPPCSIPSLGPYIDHATTPTIAAADRGLPKLAADNKISHIHIKEGTWRVYDKPNYDESGSYKDYGPGVYNLQGTTLDNKISSFRKIS